jgi:uncharacterized protein (UPF0147 family)
MIVQLCTTFQSVRIAYLLVTISKAKVVPRMLARVALRAIMKCLTVVVGKMIANTAAIRNIRRLSSESSTVSARGQGSIVVLSC